MVHRHTPLASAFRAYTAGGARAMISTVDDAKQMQEGNNCQGMKGESWGRMEAPQNYGFTSVVADAEKAANGMIKDCAEGFISFMGGNRSFPIMGVMDDRRHRLLNLAKDAAKGASAMFGLKEWGQQLLNTEKGWFMSGNTEKKMRFQLVDNKNKQQQQGGGSGGGGGSAGGASVAALADGGDGGGGGGGSGTGQGGQQRGQKTLHKEKSETFTDMTKDAIHTKRGQGQHQCQDNHSTGYIKDVQHSCQSTASHSHIKAGASIWVAGGCFSDMPIIVKKDGLCIAPKEEQQDDQSGGGGGGASS